MADELDVEAYLYPFRTGPPGIDGMGVRGSSRHESFGMMFFARVGRRALRAASREALYDNSWLEGK